MPGTESSKAKEGGQLIPKLPNLFTPSFSGFAAVLTVIANVPSGMAAQAKTADQPNATPKTQVAQSFEISPLLSSPNEAVKIENPALRSSDNNSQQISPEKQREI